MQLLVETYLDGGVEKLRRIRFDARRIEITDNIDQWHGADYRYFKVRGSDGNLYMVRYDEIRAAWELTMYEVPATERSDEQPVSLVYADVITVVFDLSAKVRLTKLASKPCGDTERHGNLEFQDLIEARRQTCRS